MPLKVAGSSLSPERYLLSVAEGLEPTKEDLLYAGNALKNRILRRTEAGVDYRGIPFAPYSTKRPYYWYPDGAKQRASARLGALNPGLRGRNERIAKFQALEKTARDAAARMFRNLRLKSVTDGTKRTGIGIKFPNYGAFKAHLGRSTVDLRGPRAPHMLQAITVSASIGGMLTLGIYGDAADRAEGHNEGTRRGLPKRRFFDASEDDIQFMSELLLQRALERVDRL
jgi:hypothetical protein